MASQIFLYLTAGFLIILIIISILFIRRYRNDYIQCESTESIICPTYNCDDGINNSSEKIKEDHRPFRGINKTFQANDRYINANTK